MKYTHIKFELIGKDAYNNLCAQYSVIDLTYILPKSNKHKE